MCTRRWSLIPMARLEAISLLRKLLDWRGITHSHLLSHWQLCVHINLQSISTRITLLFAFIASQIDLSKELAGDPRKAALRYSSTSSCPSNPASLSNLMHEMHSREMRFPLYALVDVGGYRVIAVSKLPVGGPETLAYGSNNASSSSSFEFCSSDINAENVARLLCEQMHIKKHKIQTASETVSIWGCYDLEIHRDADGQYVVVKPFMRQQQSINRNTHSYTMNPGITL